MALWRARDKPPVELVVANLEDINVTENRKQILFPVSHLERVQSLHRNIFTREREL